MEAPRETNLPVTFDLRRRLDFDFWHLPGAINYPLATLSANTPSPCFDPAVLEAQWKELDDKVAKACNGDVGSRLRPAFHKTDSEPVVVYCYQGDTARMAASIFNAKGILTWSIAGGAHALWNARLDLKLRSDVFPEGVERFTKD